MIQDYFYEMVFALPQASMEPPDGRTLVNLPTYFALKWPEEGYEPQEVDTTTLVGQEVRIRPVFQSATYSFGDGESYGPTESPGGSWPDGDVIHTYVKKGTVQPSISVTYGGEVSVEGGDWTNINASVTVDGPPQPLDVLTSRNRLVAD